MKILSIIVLVKAVYFGSIVIIMGMNRGVETGKFAISAGGTALGLLIIGTGTVVSKLINSRSSENLKEAAMRKEEVTSMGAEDRPAFLTDHLCQKLDIKTYQSIVTIPAIFKVPTTLSN